MLFNIPAGSDICEFLNQIGMMDIVFATSAADYCSPDPCAVGASVIANAANTNPNYKLLVFDPDDNCIKWMNQPDAQVYDSELMGPWFQEATGSKGGWEAGPGTAIVGINIPAFTQNVKIKITYNVLNKSGGAGSSEITWGPVGPSGSSVVDILAGMYIRTREDSGTGWDSSEFTVTHSVNANAAGMVAYIQTKGQISTNIGVIQGTITAIAFKA